MNNIIYLIFDSCRYDSFTKANTPNIAILGKAEKRYSYASWTSPGHYVYLMGLMPHRSPKHVFASNVYKYEFSKWKERLGIDELSEEYKRLGLQRDRQLFALRQAGQLKALVMMDLTDLGLNLSDLTNCIKVFVIDNKALSANILDATLDLLATKYQKADLPALLYPVAYADEQAIAYEKCYSLWALSLQFTDQYFKYINRLLRFI